MDADFSDAHKHHQTPDPSHELNGILPDRRSFSCYRQWEGIDISNLKAEFEYSDPTTGKSVMIALEPFIIDSLESEDALRLKWIERESWDPHPVHVDQATQDERLVGNPNLENRLPNLIIALRINNVLTAAIFMSISTLDKEIELHFITYRNVERAHRPEGEVIVDFSVAVDPKFSSNKDNPKLFDAIAGATIALAQRLNKEFVLAYSRAEFMHVHRTNNPRFQGEEGNRYRLDNGHISKKLIFCHFAEESRNHTLQEIAKFFGFTPSEDLIKSLLHQCLVRNGKANTATDAEKNTLRERIIRYCKLSDWSAPEVSPTGEEHDTPLSSRRGALLLNRYADFHINVIGDPFLSKTHCRCGANFAAVIPESRADDPASLRSNVLMAYPVPKVPEHILRDSLSLKGYRVIPEVVTVNKFADDGSVSEQRVIIEPEPYRFTSKEQDPEKRQAELEKWLAEEKARFCALTRKLRRAINSTFEQE